MKLYKIKLLIPAIPFPAEWTVEVSNPQMALKKAKGEMKNHGLTPHNGKALETEIVSSKDV